MAAPLALDARVIASTGLFGWSVALSADGATLAVGANHESSSARGINGDQENNEAASSGAVYVFQRTVSGWVQEAYIKASNTRLTVDDPSGARFGWSVALSGDGMTLAVGDPFEDSASRGIDGNQDSNAAEGSGAVYVFRRSSSGTWAQQAYVKPSNHQCE